MTPDISIYIHIPFCTHRCAYCDFNTYAGQEGLIPSYVEAVCREIDFVGRTAEEEGIEIKAHTLFFGGGTPSLLNPRQVAEILAAIRASFDLTGDAEITIEANPGTVTEEALARLLDVGINRISFGVQSANPFELKMLERAHTFFDVIEAVTSARKAGFKNLNLDLIYGLPEQSLGSWQATVNRILDLHPEHISAYALTLEHGTPFGRWASRGLLPLPDPDLAADMYEWAGETLAAGGFDQYEISNWALNDGKLRTSRPPSSIIHGPSSISHDPPSFACRHNLQYWRSLPYLAFGAGAHGYANGHRYSNALRIKTYIDRLMDASGRESGAAYPLSPAAVNRHRQTVAEDMSEFMMTGMRLTREGVSSHEFERRFGKTLREMYGKEIDDLLKSGLIESVPAPGGDAGGGGEILLLTSRGRLLGNQVFIRFV